MEYANIPVVVVAYNRPFALQRILQSISRADYPVPVKLIISIDGGGDPDILRIGKRFEWKHGEKVIIEHPENLGLKEHILSCGNLSELYDGIVILEDDLYVSPAYYRYVQESQRFFHQDENISGVGLYTHQYNETACFPFIPLSDNSDIFFMQLACSWGQCWLKHQWSEFIEWYENKNRLHLTPNPGLPGDVHIWPNTSWKKEFIQFNIEHNKFFVYPRISLTTNFGDAGTHHRGTEIFQVALQYGQKKYEFKKFVDSYARYDSYCEILPACINRFNSKLMNYDYCVDLYGMKNLNLINNEYVLTSKNYINPQFSFARKMKPLEVNIIEDLQGDRFGFTVKNNVRNNTNFMAYRQNICSDQEEHFYHYQITKQHYHKLDSLTKE